MVDVQFEEENSSSSRAQILAGRRRRSDSFLLGLVLKTGIVKNESGANLILLLVALACFIGTIYLYWNIIIPPKVTFQIKSLPQELIAKFPGLKAR